MGKEGKYPYILISLLILFGGISQLGAAIHVIGPMQINASGYYALQNNIFNSTALVCINISSSDVVFDGMGYTIDGRDSANSYGIYVYNASSPPANITIRNVTVRDWYSGIRFRGTNGGRIEQIVASSNTGQGIQLLASSTGNAIAENTVSNNPYGINCTASSGNSITATAASSNTYGIYLDSSHDNTISGNSAISNTNTGIYLRSSTVNTLSGNTASTNHYGIYLTSSTNNVLSGNTASRNTHTGITLSASGGNIVTDSTASSNTNYGILITASSNNNSLTTNVLASNAYGIYGTSSSNNQLSSNSATNNANTGIYLLNAHNTTLLSNTANSNMNAGIALSASNFATIEGTLADSNTNYGISLTNCTASTIMISQVSGSPYGIYLTASPANSIIENAADGNTYGVYLTSSHRNVIFDAASTNNMHSGIYLTGSNNNTLSDITTSGNSNSGIYLASSTNTTIETSLATGNTHSGVYLATTSNYNAIRNSTLTSNTYGIYLTASSNNTLSGIGVALNTHSGFYLTNSHNNTLTGSNTSSNTNYGIYLASSRNNTITDTYFNNTNNAGFGGTIYPNIWNTTKIADHNIIGGPFRGGNFWAGPFGTGFSQISPDMDNDGICDGAYTLASGNIDRLPLHTYIPPPTADYSANITSGMRPLAVSFTDTSMGTQISAWYWDFGDGSTSTIQNPVHVYELSGTYDVRLNVSTVGGSDWKNVTAYITVTNATPLARFMSNITAGYAPLAVQFTDTTTGGTPDAWFWTFGDGTTSTSQHPVHVYGASGTYDIQLRSSNPDGFTWENKTAFIVVSPVPSPPPRRSGGGHSGGSMTTAIPTTISPSIPSETETVIVQETTGSGTPGISPLPTSNTSPLLIEPPPGASPISIPIPTREMLIVSGILCMAIASGTVYSKQLRGARIPAHGMLGVLGAVIAAAGILDNGYIMTMIQGDPIHVSQVVLETFTVVGILCIALLGSFHSTGLTRRKNAWDGVFQWLRGTGIFFVIILYLLV